jgi:hypothetical protein
LFVDTRRAIRSRTANIRIGWLPWHHAPQRSGRRAKCLIEKAFFGFGDVWNHPKLPERQGRYKLACSDIVGFCDCTILYAMTCSLPYSFPNFNPHRNARTMQAPFLQDSMRIVDYPLNGNIAISQFQLMECGVAAI